MLYFNGFAVAPFYPLTGHCSRYLRLFLVVEQATNESFHCLWSASLHNVLFDPLGEAPQVVQVVCVESASCVHNPSNGTSYRGLHDERPSISRLLHMPSRLYIAVGMQNDSVSAMPNTVLILHNALGFLDGDFVGLLLFGDYFDEFGDADSFTQHA